MVPQEQTGGSDRPWKCIRGMVIASTTISGDGIYAEYTYNGDKQELYEDVYGKITNTCHTEE